MKEGASWTFSQFSARACSGNSRAASDNNIARHMKSFGLIAARRLCEDTTRSSSYSRRAEKWPIILRDQQSSRTDQPAYLSMVARYFWLASAEEARTRVVRCSATHTRRVIAAAATRSRALTNACVCKMLAQGRTGRQFFHSFSFSTYVSSFLGKKRVKSHDKQITRRLSRPDRLRPL